MSYNRRTLAPDSIWAVAAAVLMFVSAVVRTLYYVIIPPSEADIWQILLHYILPVASCLIMGITLLTRKNNLVPTIFPVLLGVIFFAVKALDFELWHCIICLIIYAAFAAIYILTVLGVLDTRLPLMILSGAAFLWHVLVEDLFLCPPDSLIAFMPAFSVLMIILALFLVSCGMRRGRLY